jgi:hypothetical protein
LEVRDLIKSEPEKAKPHFNKEKNWTNKSTAELEVLLKSYKGKATTAQPAPKSNVADVVETVASAKARQLPATPVGNVAQLQEALEVVKDFLNVLVVTTEALNTAISNTTLAATEAPKATPPPVQKKSEFDEFADLYKTFKR